MRFEESLPVSKGRTVLSFHVPVAIVVLALAWALALNALQFCILLLCIGLVLSAELFNSALELLAKAVTQEHDPFVRDALDVASAAVLIASIFAATVGLTVLLPAALQRLS